MHSILVHVLPFQLLCSDTAADHCTLLVIYLDKQYSTLTNYYKLLGGTPFKCIVYILINKGNCLAVSLRQIEFNLFNNQD